MTGWLTPFIFRGLKFRLHSQGVGLQVYDPSDKKWYGTEFWYPRTLKELCTEVPDIGKWIDRSYFGSIRFPEPPIPSSNPSVSKKAIAEAELEAKDEIARLIRESRSTEDALKSARMELEAIEAELGKRTIPYGGDFYRKRRGRLPQAFPGVPAAILDTKRIIYREFIDELEQQLAVPKTRKQMLIDYDRGHTLEQLKEMCRKKGLSVSGGKKELIARLI